MCLSKLADLTHFRAPIYGCDHLKTPCVCADLTSTDSEGYHLACEVFDPNVSGRSPSSLYNPNFTTFQSLLVNVLNWGDTVRLISLS